MNNIFKRILIFTLLCGSILSIMGCSPSKEKTANREEKAVSIIEAVLKNTFFGPDEELRQLLKSDSNETTKTLQALNKYNEEKFKPYFTEDAYEEYSIVYGLAFLQAAYRNDYQLKVNKIDISRKQSEEEIYDFEAHVQYQKEGSNDVVRITGEAGVNKAGKITHMVIRNDGELMRSLHQK